MQAKVGERIRVHGRTVGAPEHEAEIIEVHGDDGAPPYLVRFADGHETLLFPGPDAEIQHGNG
ncbi:MAG TPA: DUF1918 domain-containing protein [Nocardioidaceae bacterium]|nr:DUF1918 domain-containing protein [Nocardioidaceae bacterium]